MSLPILACGRNIEFHVCSGPELGTSQSIFVTLNNKYLFARKGINIIYHMTLHIIQEKACIIV